MTRKWGIDYIPSSQKWNGLYDVNKNELNYMTYKSIQS